MDIFHPNAEQEKDLCRELGLDPDLVQSIDFHVRPGHFVTATVEYAVPVEVAVRIFDVPVLVPVDDRQL